MKNSLIALFLIMFFQLSSGQSPRVKIDKQCFLIGTLTDYMGRIIYPGTNIQVDNYFRCEYSLASKIDSLFKEEYSDLRFVDTGLFKIYSKQLTDKINDYYIYNHAVIGDSVGSLRSDIFKTNQQKYSFLTGVYVRFGVENDTTFCINICNSLSKAKLCFELLKELECQNVSFKILSGNIPIGYFVYFAPTSEMKEYFNEFMYLRHKLNEDLNRQISEQLNKYAR